MDYRLKVIIAGVEMIETSDIVDNQADGVEYSAPSISNVILQDNASAGVMQIGATPSDQLTFTVNNPNRRDYDGETVEFWIAPPDDDTDNMVETAEIEDETGNTAETEGIDEAGLNDEYDDGAVEGDDPTAEDLADVAAQSEAQIEGRYTLFEGENQTVETAVTDESEEPEWRRVGTYYVDSQKNSDSDGSLILSCFDSMHKLNDQFTPTNGTASIQNLFNDLRTQVLADCGVAIDAFEYDEELFDPNTTITWPLKLCSYREALGYFAGLIGAFATCGDDGSIGFSLYSFTDELYLESTLNYINKDSSGEMELDGIQCNIGVTKEQYLDTGFDADITFDNPLMTQDALDEILETYKGIRFSGGTLNMTWDDSILAGSLIRLMSPEEYANYLGLANSLADSGELSAEEILALKEQMNALGEVYMVSSQTIDFSGDASTTIISRCYSGNQNANQMVGPYNQRMLRLGEEISGLETRVDEAETAMDAIESSITSLQGRVTTAEGDITLVEGDIETLQVRVADAEDDIAEAASKAASAIQSAEAAAGAAESASESAGEASRSASSALKQLSLVEQVVESLDWIYKHGEFTPSQDTEVNSSKYYFEYDGNAYSVVLAPSGDPSALGYYELTGIDEAVSNYIATHLALTDDGLYVQMDENAAKLQVTSTGIIIYDEDGHVIAEYSDTITLGDPDGLHITLGSGELGFWEGSSQDVSNKVAYINANTLNINNAELKKKLRIGMLVWDVRSDTRVTLKYAPE